MPERHQPLWAPPSDVVWRELVTAHVELCHRALDFIRGKDPSSWDQLICWLEEEGGVVVFAFAKSVAPFWLPQTPDHVPVSPSLSAQRRHFVDERFEYDLRMHVGAFDGYPFHGFSTEDFETFADLVFPYRLRALQECLSDPSVARLITELHAVRPFGIHWCHAESSLHYSQLHYLGGSALPPTVTPQTALAAMAPLFWHKRSFVGRHHIGLQYESDVLVRASLIGPRVNDSTLALLTPETAARCTTLRAVELVETKTSAAAIERFQNLLPGATVTCWPRFAEWPGSKPE